MKPIRPRMDSGTEHALRSDLSRAREADVLAALAEARSSGDTEAEAIVKYEMERRGVEE